MRLFANMLKYLVKSKLYTTVTLSYGGVLDNTYCKCKRLSNASVYHFCMVFRMYQHPLSLNNDVVRGKFA